MHRTLRHNPIRFLFQVPEEFFLQLEIKNIDKLFLKCMMQILNTTDY